jgi:hypothetical protein
VAALVDACGRTTSQDSADLVPTNPSQRQGRFASPDHGYWINATIHGCGGKTEYRAFHRRASPTASTDRDPRPVRNVSRRPLREDRRFRVPFAPNRLKGQYPTGAARRILDAPCDVPAAREPHHMISSVRVSPSRVLRVFGGGARFAPLLCGPVTLFGALLCGCSSSSSPPACPSVTVTVDGGTDAAPQIGVYLSQQECQRYCDSNHPVCAFTSTTEVKCMPGCD